MTDRDVTLGVWIALAAVLVAVEVAGRRSAGRLPVVADAVRAVTAPVAGRVVVLLGWAWLGWHVFAR